MAREREDKHSPPAPHSETMQECVMKGNWSVTVSQGPDMAITDSGTYRLTPRPSGRRGLKTRLKEFKVRLSSLHSLTLDWFKDNAHILKATISLLSSIPSPSSLLHLRFYYTA